MKTEQTKSGRTGIFSGFSIVICIILVLGAVIMGCVNSYGIIKNMVNIVTAIVCGMLVQFFYTQNDGKYVQEIHSKTLYYFGIITSMFLIFLYGYEFLGGIWLISVAVITVIDGMKHGMVCYFLCMVQYVLFAEDYVKDNKILLYYLVLGVVIVLMFSENGIRELVFSVITMVALSAVLLIIQFGFDIRLIEENKNYLIIQIMSSFVMAVATVIVKYMYNKFGQIKVMCDNDVKVLNELLEADYELIRRLQTFSPNLFIHSMRVSVMSMRVAQKMGYDSLLAKAGGMYHEIGRIKKEEDYVEATNDIAYAYDFPKCLSELIFQNCDKNEMPESKEAAVVMLSDSIVSMAEYFMQNANENKPSKEKLIDSVFKNRLKSGKLDKSGVSGREIEVMKVIYKQIDIDF